MNLLKKLIPAGLLFGLLSTTAFAQNRIATVDLGKVFTNYWKTKQAQAAVEDRKADLDKTYKEMMDTYKKAKDEYQKMLADVNDPAVSTEERDKRKKAAEDKLKDIKDQEESIMQFDRQARTTLDEQLKRMRENILTEIRAAITAKSKSAGYTLVFDTAGQSISATPLVLYSAGNDNDITEAVLSQLNAGAPEPTKPDVASTNAPAKGGKK